jgi:ABC-type branched-subunit amino acid transport system substrate-binding protein
MKKNRLLVLLGIISLVTILAVLPFMTACPSPEEAKKLQIGAIVCMTGWFSGWDIMGLNETEIMADIINERGGITINGQQYEIEVLVEDGKSSLDGVQAATNTLIYDKQVKYIVGPAAFFARAMGPVCTANQVINVPGYVSYYPDEIGPDQPYTFSCSGGSPGRFWGMEKILEDKFPDAKNLCLVSPVGALHERLEAYIRENLAAEGYNVVGEVVTFADDAVDWSPYAAKIKANKEADLIFWEHGITFHGGNMLKSMREIGDYRWVIFGSNPSGSALLDITGKEAGTNLVTQTPLLNAPGNPPDLDELLGRVKAQYGTDVETVLEASSALYVLVNMIEEAQSLDPTVVKENWESMDGQTVDTIWGPAVISGTETFGIKGHGLGHAWASMIVENGEYYAGKWYDTGPLP